MAITFMMVVSTVVGVAPIPTADSAGAAASTATIGGSIWTGSNDGTGPNLTPTAADAINGASVMVQNQHSGGGFITYGVVTGNTWTADVPAPGDYVVMFSAPGYDLTSREFTVAVGDNQSKDAFLPPYPLPTANLLFYTFYDNYVNGEDDFPDDPPMNGVTVTVTDEDGNVLRTGVTGSQSTITLADNTVLTNTDGLYFFDGLPPGDVLIYSDPSTAYTAAQPVDPAAIPSSDLGASWDSSTEFYLMTSEEGGKAWEASLYPGDPGTENGGYLAWHGYVEKLGQVGTVSNPTVFDVGNVGSITGTLIDADSANLDPLEPFPVPGEDHPGVTLNTTVPDGFVVLSSNAETAKPHPVATTAADPVTGAFSFNDVPPGSYKLFLSDEPIDYVWNQQQVRVSPGVPVNVQPLVPRFFARARGYVYDDATGDPIAGATVNVRYKSGSIKESTTTDANGWYLFDNLPEIEVLGHLDVEPPDNYRGTMTTETFYPGGKALTDRFVNGVSGAEKATYSELPVTFNGMNRYIQWYTANYRADFHLEPVPSTTGDITGFAWNDNLATGTWTADGLYQPGDERTLHGVTIELWDSAGTTKIDTVATGSVSEADLEAQGWIPPYTSRVDESGGVFVGPMPGYYEFRDLAPGDYQVRFILPDGYSASPAGSDTVVVTVSGGARVDQNFGANTLVPQAGEIEGGVFDDIRLDNNPLSLLYQEKAGIPGAPIGIYDHLGYFLGQGAMGNPLCYVGSPAGLCPTGEDPIQKPEMERRAAPGVRIYLGNDPTLVGHNPNYLPMALPYNFDQGQFKFEADWSLLPTAGVGVAGPDLGDMPLVAGNAPTINAATTAASVAAGANLSIFGADFGPAKDGGTVTLGGTQLEVVTWSDVAIVVKVPLDAATGTLLVATTAGISNGPTLTVTVTALGGLALAAAPAVVLPANAAYVDASNTGAADGTVAKPWPTISQALANLPALAAGTPRNVIVAAGTYEEQVHIVESDVRIIGAGPHETTVDGTTAVTINAQGVPNAGGPVFYIGQGPITGPVENITISGFTITGGSVADEVGSGIFGGLNNRNIDINNNMIVRNGGYYGGGIWFHKSVHDVSIWSNTIAENGNYGGYGGGISVNDEPEDPNTPEHAQPEHIVDDTPSGPPPGTYQIYNNLIFHNLSADSGGGITLYEVKDRLEIYDNMILENVAQDHGGGLFVEDSGPVRVYGNVFYRNYSPDDGGAISFEDVGDGTTQYHPISDPGATAHQVEVFDNLFAENIADGHGENNARGGAIAFDDTFDALIRNNTIVGNIVAGSEAPAGGAIDAERNGHEYNGEDAPWIWPGYSNPIIRDNIIWDNWLLVYDQPNDGVEEDLDYTWGSNYRWTKDQLHVDNPAVQNEWETANNSLSFTRVDNNVIECGYPAGTGNLDSDPVFADPAGLDWRLAAGSPVFGSGLGMSGYAAIPTGILGAITMPVRGSGSGVGCPPTPMTPPPLPPIPTPFSAPSSAPPSSSVNAVPAVPGSPVGVTAIAWNHRAVVSWVAPSTTGDTPITSYTVSAWPGTAECSTADAATLTCDVEGLTNFTEYTFTVVATNTAGDSPGGSAIATPGGETCDSSGSPFGDVSGSYAEESVGCLFNLKVTTGTSADTYSPHDAVTREQMAAFVGRLWRSLSPRTFATTSPFTDISGSFAADDIGFIYNMGAARGTSATTYSPNGVLSREQVAAFLARTWRELGGVCDSTATPFTDVSGSFAVADIACIYNLEITIGTSSTTFTPTGVVTREQVAAFLARFWQAAVNHGL